MHRQPVLAVLAVLLLPFTTGLTFTSPALHSTISLAPNSTADITWTTDPTDPDLINLFFGGVNFGVGLGVDVSTSSYSYSWDTGATGQRLAEGDPTTLYLGSPFNIYAGSATTVDILVTGPNFTVTGYTGPTTENATSTGFSGAAGGSIGKGWGVMGIAAMLVGVLTILL